MKYNVIDFSRVSEILIKAASGVSAVCGYGLVISDMVYTLHDLREKSLGGLGVPYYIAIRGRGVEGGTKENVIGRCKTLGYPFIVAKVETAGNVISDYNLTITFTNGFMNSNFDYRTHTFEEINNL